MKKILLTCILVFSMLTGCSDEKKVTDKEITVKIQDTDYTGKYTGLLVKGIPNGEATFVYDDGTVKISYEGSFENGELKGAGKLESNNYIMKYKDYDRIGEYSGDSFDGVASGNGTFTAINTDNQKYTYIGEFSNGLFNGQGIREFENKEYRKAILKGTWTDGEYTPTVKEFIVYYGTFGFVDYNIPDKSLVFLDEHPNFFPAQSLDEINDFVDTTIEAKYLDKSHTDFGDKLAKIENIRVINVEFYENFIPQVTVIQGYDNSGYFYYILYLGDIDVFNSDYINLYALPIGKGEFHTTFGAQMIPMYVASYIEIR